MEKKVYARPRMETIDIKLKPHLLAGSTENVELYNESTYEQI